MGVVTNRHRAPFCFCAELFSFSALTRRLRDAMIQKICWSCTC
jgi:hypothetical protein